MIKQKLITNYWEKEVCGIRYSKDKKLSRNYDEIAKKRYYYEPYIKEFAFGKSDQYLLNKKVLEIGVGAGTDFVGFLKRNAICYGIDATEAAVKETKNNIKKTLKNNNYNLEYLKKTNADKLPFDNDLFDLVYSHGVLHHAKNTMQCISEAIRVLKPGGEIKLMVYSKFSSTGFMLWCLYGLLRGKPFLSQEDVIFNHLESPGTKCYSKNEFRKILDGFGLENIVINKHVGAGDQLLMPPSHKYSKSIIYKIVRLIYPKFLIKKLQNIFGLAMTASAVKKN